MKFRLNIFSTRREMTFIIFCESYRKQSIPTRVHVKTLTTVSANGSCHVLRYTRETSDFARGKVPHVAYLNVTEKNVKNQKNYFS